MSKAEARQLLERELASLRERPYEELRWRIPTGPNLLGLRYLRAEEEFRGEVAGDSGAVYGIETEVFWKRGRDGALRVLVTVDDGGTGAFRPVSGSFAMAPDGTAA